MNVSANAIANIFLDLAKNENKRLTNMQLQKLVYIANGYCLAICNQPLYHDNTHAWQWGPVITKLYESLRKYGSNVVTEPIECKDSSMELNEANEKIVSGVWKAYRNLSGSQLSHIKKVLPGVKLGSLIDSALFL